MPLDAMLLSALTGELSHALCGQKIDKIRQPERDVVLFSLRSGRLLLHAGSGRARAQMTQAELENPAVPPMFCMLLRKHLQGGRILSVEQPSGERMLSLRIDSMDELGVTSEKRLILEMMGRGTNLILVGADGRIVDCLRRVDGLASETRQVLPGLFYREPPRQDKLPFLETPPEQRRALLQAADGEQCADNWLLQTFSGLSPLLARELCHRACGDASPRLGTLDEKETLCLADAMDALQETVSRGEGAPYLLLRDGQPFDFSFMAIQQYGEGVTVERMESFSALLDAFYARRDKAEALRRRAADLTKTAKTAYERVARRLAAQKQELKKSEMREEMKKCGELITANLWRMKKGQRTLLAEDYYVEGCPEISIALDPLKTPQQNAVRYFKDYAKAKSAEKFLTEQIAKGEEELRYLASVLEETAHAESEKEFGEIRRELTETGYLKKQKTGKKEKPQSLAPRRFVSPAGTEILVGRSNVQNDALTKNAMSRDLWLHAQKIHGSHVVIKCAGIFPEEETLQMAASLAAYYSQGRDSGKVPVDYTWIKNVKKPAGSLPGKAVYTDYKTIFAEPKSF